jgi:hypothetical protein
MNPPGFLNPFGGSWDSITMYAGIAVLVIAFVVLLIRGNK